MSDNTINRGEPDRSRLAMGEDYEVRFWTEKFGVSAEELNRAVEAVGNSAEAVEAHIARGSH